MEIDNENEAEEICLTGWQNSEDSELKTKVIKGLELQIKINNLKREGKEIPEEYLIELSKI
jgi:hypothetical protein